MRGDVGPEALSPERLAKIMTSATEALAAIHPTAPHTEIAAMVYEVACELVSRVEDPARLSAMLRMRASARLEARSGHPVPIRRRKRVG